MSLYSKSIFEMKVLNRFKYRGRGRPRKSDYTLFNEIQKTIADYSNKMFSSRHPTKVEP